MSSLTKFSPQNTGKKYDRKARSFFILKGQLRSTCVPGFELRSTAYKATWLGTESIQQLLTNSISQSQMVHNSSKIQARISTFFNNFTFSHPSITSAPEQTIEQVSEEQTTPESYKSPIAICIVLCLSIPQFTPPKSPRGVGGVGAAQILVQSSKDQPSKVCVCV